MSYCCYFLQAHLAWVLNNDCSMTTNIATKKSTSIVNIALLLGGRPKAPHPAKRHPTPTKGTPKSGNHQGSASIDRIRNMILKCAIHWQGLVQGISTYRFKKHIPRARSRQHVGSSCPELWYFAAGHARSSTKLYYQSTKVQPAAGDGRSSTKA